MREKIGAFFGKKTQRIKAWNAFVALATGNTIAVHHKETTGVGMGYTIHSATVSTQFPADGKIITTRLQTYPFGADDSPELHVSSTDAQGAPQEAALPESIDRATLIDVMRRLGGTAVSPAVRSHSGFPSPL